MARAARPWFRFYVEAVDDRKIRRLAPAQRWLWIAVLSAARESPVPGSLYIAGNVPMTLQELGSYADLDPRSVRTGLELMTNLGMVTVESNVIVVTNWHARQYESDNVTTRTQRHRERSKERSEERSTEQPRNVRGNTPETETETENRSTTQVTSRGGTTSTRARTTPPPEFCPNHPTGTDKPCRACATTRSARETWDTDQRAVDAKARDARLRAANDAAINADLTRASPNREAFQRAKAEALAAIRPDQEPANG